jgi:hypothetical protein
VRGYELKPAFQVNIEVVKKRKAQPTNKKRGNPGDLCPARVAWLETWLPKVQQHFGDGTTDKKRPSVPAGTAVYAPAFVEYWKQFPLGLPLKQSPPADPDELAKFVVDSGTKDFEQRKTEVEKVS